MPDHQRVAIVTGSSRGIGRAIAVRLARDGHSVVINYHANAEAAATVVKAIQEQGGEAVAVQADVGSLSSHARLVQSAIDRWGRIDVLVNNAGITSPGRRDLLQATEESWDSVFATNLKGPFFLAQKTALKMLEFSEADADFRGTVVNISSISSYTVSLNRADYCIAKAGMEMMTRLFAARLAEDRIRVFEIRPGIIASDMTLPVQEKYDRLIAEGLTPIRRWGTPDDVARAVSAVVSDAFPFTTGEQINVDGGFHIRRL